jgi:hypothetical protein
MIWLHALCSAVAMSESWLLVGPDGNRAVSPKPGTIGGHSRLKIYGRLDCRSARASLSRGHYAKHRVFFIDETTARLAGYRPCAVCMPLAYTAWKAAVANMH